MQEAYKRVLERRRGQIVEQIRWTKEFSAGLEKHGLVSRDELKEIEMELNHKTRVFLAVTRILSRDQPGIFDRFRQLLQETGDTTMAESLDFDRQRIQWEFEKPSKTSSMMQYIDHIVAELIQRTINEPEADIRQRLMLEAQRRLDELRNSLRQQLFDREQLRATVMQTLGASLRPNTAATQHRNRDSQPEMTTAACTMTSSMYTLSELENMECRKDQKLIEEVRSTVERLRRLAHRPRDAATSEKDAVDVSHKHNDGAVHRQRTENYDSFEPQSYDEDEEMWDNDLVEKDELDINNNNENKNLVRMDQVEYDKLIELLKPFATATRQHMFMFNPRKSPPRSSSSSSSAASTMMTPVGDDIFGHEGNGSPEMTSLYDMAKGAVAELDHWKRRACLLSSERRRLGADKNEDEPLSRYERAILSGTNGVGVHRVTSATDPDVVGKAAATSSQDAARTRRVSMPNGYLYPKVLKSSASTSALSQHNDESTSNAQLQHRSQTMATLTSNGSGRLTPTLEAPLLSKRRSTQQHQQQPVFFQTPMTMTTTPMKATSADRTRKLSVTCHPVLRTAAT